MLVLPARWPAACAIGGLLRLAFVDPSAWPLFHWGPVFCFGIVLFLRVSGTWSRPAALAAWLVVALVCWLTTGRAVTLVAAATTLAIALCRHHVLGRQAVSHGPDHVPTHVQELRVRREDLQRRPFVVVPHLVGADTVPPAHVTRRKQEIDRRE